MNQYTVLMNENSHPRRINPIKALTFGEALFDIIRGSAHLGGAPLNLAAHLAKLGAKPAVITAVGRDELGEILLAWDAITPDEKEFRAFSGEEWDVFCFGTLAQRTEESRKTLERLFSEIKAKHFFYDINLRTGFYKKSDTIFS
jgi:fructokinase